MARGSSPRTSVSPTSTTFAPDLGVLDDVARAADTGLGDLDRPVGDQRRRDARTSSRSTSRVLRLRALTPIRSASASSARSTSSASSCTSTSGRQADRPGALDEALERVLVEGGHDQQRHVGTGGARLPQLVRGGDEVLAQHGHVDRAAHRAQVVEGAVEAALLGEHADRGGATGRVVGGERGGILDRRRARPRWGWTA